MEEIGNGNRTNMQTMWPQMGSKEKDQTKNLPKQKMQQPVLANGKKKCGKCNKILPIEDFTTQLHKTGKRYPKYCCRTCANKKAREYHLKNRKKHLEQHKKWYNKNKEEIKKYTKERYEKQKQRGTLYRWRKTNPVRHWAITSIQGHRRAGYKVKITRNELTEKANETNICLYCNNKLDYSIRKEKKFMHRPSLDRIDNGKILTMENTQIICARCNLQKGNKTHKELVTWCLNIATKFKEELKQ